MKTLNKILSVTLAATTGFMSFACGTAANIAVESSYENAIYTSSEVDMTKAEKEYNAMLENPETIPVNFIYRDKYYAGLSPKYFKVKEKTEKKVDGGTQTTTVFSFRGELDVTLISTVYPDYSAYDYTVYFENNGKSNSGVIRELNAVDTTFDCDDVHLKGIYGDAGYRYLPYDVDLKDRPVNFTLENGRATHVYFPYFNLEAEGNGTMLALGWGGTWQADFEYDHTEKKAHYVGTGTLGLCTYLKPGEKIRTPLVAFVRYYDADEDTATNMWRRWYIDCNMPYEDASKSQKVKPHDAVYVAFDTGRPNSDGSISEGHDTWLRSMSEFYNNGGTADFRWVDAGWYCDPNGNTVPADWWGSVGTWEFDKIKWPGTSLIDCAQYCKSHGTDTLLWFEPERVTKLDGMVKNYGYDRDWVLSDVGHNNAYLNNIGIDECRQWTLDRIKSGMIEGGASLYREDFNVGNVSVYWNVGDMYGGDNRKGITENLYMQGHYKMWDEVIEWCAETERYTFIDSCASGGGRNDLESMRRGVPFLRSDSDRTEITRRLAYSSVLNRWLPYSGCFAKEGTWELDIGKTDLYVLRASNTPVLAYLTGGDLNYTDLVRFQEERREYQKYFFKDFYNLTPYLGVSDNSNWTAYMYFDSDTDSGVISAFRPEGCQVGGVIVGVKGVDTEHYYRVRDVDGVQSKDRVKGSELIAGLQLTAKHDRTALIIYVEPVE